MRLTTSSETVAEVGLLALAGIWGVNFVVIKSVLVDVHPFVFNGLRFPLAALAFVALFSLVGSGDVPRPRREDLPRVIALGLLGHLSYQLLFITGIDGTTAGNASLILATTPVWIVMTSVLSGHERPRAAVWTGCGLALVGMTLVVLGDPREPGVSEATLLGDTLMVGAAVAWSLYTVGGRGLVHRYGALPVTAWTLWVGTPFLVLIGVPFLDTEAPAGWSWKVWAGIAYAGVAALSVAYVLWYRGVRQLGSSRTAVYSNLVPVVALAAAWIWLGEVPGVTQGVGAAIILAGVTLARLAGGPRRPAASSA